MRHYGDQHYRDYLYYVEGQKALAPYARIVGVIVVLRLGYLWIFG